ncbi:hypothetical protein [Megalodesulfovibrio gigas]|uniref:DUF106 domain-containing protein n=1 Tax=Megalodesulfovibrio gigas (strain ATCC 19364 / DSM 1382 / NCIMB 9332 / VKM B-1759) TaxID=1121448 RepID=T2G7D4_MEGG1|nr:hypothetical protein [Megalodesulfovibrio gigas]AGW12188.1 hypothetical protein DGI_0257 [Megalodesulfovibrio gigas DSM 1382 = ATCC 19364]
MSSLADLNTFLDPGFIWAFRLMPDPHWGFVVGSVYVALCAIVVGDVAMSLAYRINRSAHLAQQREMKKHSDMSFEALVEKDKAAFKACNTLANDAFGRNFFLGATLFCASIWPLALALGWMDYRFGRVIDLSAPFLGQVRPEFWFIPLYIVLRIAFAKIKYHLPVYGRLHALAKADAEALEAMPCKRPTVQATAAAESPAQTGTAPQAQRPDTADQPSA